MNEKERVLSLLKEYNLYAKKSFGQNFLINDGIINRIFKSLEASSFDDVIEIGPGLGSLTNKLADESKKLICVDADRDMVTVLNDLYTEKTNVKIIESDFLRYNPNLETRQDNRLFVGNLPYNITSRLIEYFLDCGFKRMAIMVQKEVAIKLDYKSSGKECSPLGAFLKSIGEYKLVTLVDSSCFYPQPKVDSAFIIIDKTKEYDFSLYSIYKILFKDPNKTISNCLKQFKEYINSLNYLKENDDEILFKRARQLQPNQLYDLALIIKEHK